MLIDEVFRKCVVFLYVDVKDEETGRVARTPAGTAFIVGVPIEGSRDEALLYAVTARHVIDESRPVGPLYARVNSQEGADAAFEDLEVSHDAWISHPTTDVAVAKLALPTGLDARWIGLEDICSDEVARSARVGEGDEVFFVGLFSRTPGRERNQPILRFGNVSLIPREPVPARLSSSGPETLIDGYLVEARSWGGHSGSPAFVLFPRDRNPTYETTGRPPLLLGLVHGHYDIAQDVKFTGDILGAGEVPVNAGVAVVVPGQKIIDTLMLEETVEERKEVGKRGDGPATPTPDTALDKSAADEFEEFEDLTEKVLKVPKDELDRRREAEKKKR